MSYITTEILLKAYREGFFPMASSLNGRIYWHSPQERAIFPIGKIVPSHSMKKILRQKTFSFTLDGDFNYVISKCSERSDTWISPEIIALYNQLHALGKAHSIEARLGNDIVGGLYGVTLGGAFFGESMYNDVSNAAKAAFYFLVEHLKQKKFILLDSQFINPFTEQLGAIEIPRGEYLDLLSIALALDCNFID